mgnify:CR=1 FL=1
MDADSEIHAGAAREDFYRRLIEGMRCGILVIDSAGRVVMSATSKDRGATWS